MLNDIDLKRLRLFKQVVACGGLSAAEAALDMNLSSISTHLAELETRLGLRLCERGRRGFRLTAEGHAVLDACDRLLESMGRFDSELAAIHETVSGTVRLGVVDATITDPQSRLARAIAAAKAQGPNLEITLEVRSPTELQQSVDEQRLDIAVVPHGHPGTQVVRRRLYAERVSLYAGQAHRLFERAPARLDMADLRGQDYVARGYLRESQVSRRTADLRACASTQSVEGLATMVLSGAFLGYLPEHYAASWVACGQMRPVRPDLFAHDVDFYAVAPRERLSVPAVRLLLGQLAGAPDGAH